jgi:beta-lactamase class D
MRPDLPLPTQPLRHLVLVLLVALAGCGEAPADARNGTSPEPTSTAHTPGGAAEGDTILSGIFEAHEARGTMVIRRLSDGHEWVHDPERAERSLLPASTFKIVNAAIALESDAVSGPDELFPWDGVERQFPGWNQDHTLASAMPASVVPVYQEVARRIGARDMAEWLERLEYGNGSIGGGIDQFWLTGDLRTSARAQIEFLTRWHRGQLPLSASTVEAVSRMLRHDDPSPCNLHAKTGWAFEAEVGWWVGWTDCPGETFLFALNMDIRDPSVDPANRVRIGRAALEAVGALH